MKCVLLAITLIANRIAVGVYKNTKNRITKLIIRIIPVLLTLVIILYAVLKKEVDNIDYLLLCILECINLVSILLMIEQPKFPKSAEKELHDELKHEEDTN